MNSPLKMLDIYPMLKGFIIFLNYNICIYTREEGNNNNTQFVAT